MLAQSLRAKKLRGRQGQPLESAVFLEIRDIEENNFQKSLSNFFLVIYSLHEESVCSL